MKNTIQFIIFVMILSFSHSHISYGQSSFVKSIKKQDLIQSGKDLYLKRCVGCHGEKGDGNGLAAKMLDPKPRNFTNAVFKFKKGAIGTLPSDADLMEILNQGVLGTSMPSFALLSQTEKQALIEYIKTFAPKEWKKQSTQKSFHINIPEGVFTKKEEFLKYARRGKMWYQELGCLSCHGNKGDGNGPSAKTLKDTWGNPIQPANFYKPYVKRGQSIEDVAYSIMLGVDGTPMPAHFDILESIEENFPEIKAKQYIWDLAAYVFYLRGVGAGYYKDEIKPIPKTGIPAEEVKKEIGKYLE